MSTSTSTSTTLSIYLCAEQLAIYSPLSVPLKHKPWNMGCTSFASYVDQRSRGNRSAGIEKDSQTKMSGGDRWTRLRAGLAFQFRSRCLLTFVPFPYLRKLRLAFVTYKRELLLAVWLCRTVLSPSNHLTLHPQCSALCTSPEVAAQE